VISTPQTLFQIYSVGIIIPNTVYGKIKAVFQTTNQIFVARLGMEPEISGVSDIVLNVLIVLVNDIWTFVQYGMSFIKL